MVPLGAIMHLLCISCPSHDVDYLHFSKDRPQSRFHSIQRFVSAPNVGIALSGRRQLTPSSKCATLLLPYIPCLQHPCNESISATSTP